MAEMVFEKSWAAKEQQQLISIAPSTGGCYTFCPAFGLPPFDGGDLTTPKARLAAQCVRGTVASVREMHKGKIVWDGVVEVFDLAGHPKANRIYAWSHETGDPKNPRRHVTVLHIPPVVSPQTAVQAAIVQEYKNRAKSN